MIKNIQILRAFAALAVVFYHTDFLLWGGLHTEFQGVAVFFVISGFIIPRVAQRELFSFMVRIPAKLDGCSAANWTAIPAQTGHYERRVA